MLLRLFIVFLFCATFFACAGEADSKTTVPPVETPDVPVPGTSGESDKPAADDQLYPWVNNVNVRDQPNTSGKRVARIPEGEALTWTGKTSAETETVVLRGAAYSEPWYEVKTKDGTIGWVHGGTVRRENEKKGNPIVSETKLMFPYFGRYDLTEWEARGDETTEEGDATTRTRIYYKDGQTMTITETSVGEYGYQNEYVITDVEDRVILERELAFDAVDDFTLTETVTNHLQNPAESYVRSQQLDVHPLQLGANPQLVNGEWKQLDN